MKQKKPTRSYRLVLPESMFNEVKKMAHAKDTRFLEVVKRCITIGLYLEEAQKAGKTLIIRDGGIDKQIEIL